MHGNPHSPHCARALFRPSVRSSRCCAAFALGGASSNVCPAGLLRLDTADACASAAPSVKQRVHQILNQRKASVKTIRNIVREYAGNIGDDQVLDVVIWL